MQALVFSGSRCQFLLLKSGKMCTIRLGDKTDHYAEGDIVLIISERKGIGKVRLYPAYIDKVIVKPVAELSSQELHGESPRLASLDDFVKWFTEIYEQEISLADLVTVIYFSEIMD